MRAARWMSLVTKPGPLSKQTLARIGHTFGGPDEVYVWQMVSTHAELALLERHLTSV